MVSIIVRAEIHEMQTDYFKEWGHFNIKTSVALLKSSVLL